MMMDSITIYRLALDRQQELLDWAARQDKRQPQSQPQRRSLIAHLIERIRHEPQPAALSTAQLNAPCMESSSR